MENVYFFSKVISRFSRVNIGDKDKNISNNFASGLCFCIMYILGWFEVNDGEELYLKKVLENVYFFSKVIARFTGVNIGDKDKNISKDFASVLCVSIS